MSAVGGPQADRRPTTQACGRTAPPWCGSGAADRRTRSARPPRRPGGRAVAVRPRAAGAGQQPHADGGYYAQTTALVKPNGLLGKVYMVGISPLRRLLVYPPLLRDIGRQWRPRIAE
ncbi:DUF2867 domain-containing protein [Nocardia sp. NPDC057440]|uniref:DUF2867 domain-containing protein n=1 Tax=Nocardia sp. NPDC057440 TaxID=3346134 RepID=UPI0036733A9B